MYLLQVTKSNGVFEHSLRFATFDSLDVLFSLASMPINYPSSSRPLWPLPALFLLPDFQAECPKTGVSNASFSNFIQYQAFKAIPSVNQMIPNSAS